MPTNFSFEKAVSPFGREPSYSCRGESESNVEAKSPLYIVSVDTENAIVDTVNEPMNGICDTSTLVAVLMRSANLKSSISATTAIFVSDSLIHLHFLP